jgi:hypothetical protein
MVNDIGNAGRDGVSIQLSPNPTTGQQQLLIELGQTTKLEIYFYDVLGRKVSDIFKGTLSLGSHIMEQDLSELANSAYIYTTSLGDNTKIIKSIKFE